MNEYLTIRETAKLLRFCKTTVRRMCKTGELPAIKMRHAQTGWRINAIKLQKLLDDKEEKRPPYGKNILT